MLPRVRTILLLGLPLFLSLGVDAAAQVGRLGGTVAYATPGQPTPAKGVVVIAVDGNQQAWQTRTDSNGNFAMVLRAGGYRVFAQGAPGYTTYGDVRGYVTAGADSIITPNPLFLVPSRTSSNMMVSPVLGQMTTRRGRAPAAQENRFALEVTAQERGNGRLSGRVVYSRPGGAVEPAEGVVVIAVDGNQQSWSERTGKEGNFTIVLREGSYRVFAQGAAGYTTYGVVWGHVKANDNNNVITPNPLYLVPSPPPTPTPKKQRASR